MQAEDINLPIVYLFQPLTLSISLSHEDNQQWSLGDRGAVELISSSQAHLGTLSSFVYAYAYACVCVCVSVWKKGLKNGEWLPQNLPLV